MWHQPKVTTPPAGKAVERNQVKARAVIESNDDDDLVDEMIDEVSAYAERYCSIRLLRQTIQAKCDGFSDFVRLPDGPVEDGADIAVTYFDINGDEQALPAEVFSLVQQGLNSALELQAGQSWPQIKHGSRITVEYTAGFQAVPYDIRSAILMRTVELYQRRENAGAKSWTDFDQLLTNFRRGY